jgi:hypothetical protein
VTDFKRSGTDTHWALMCSAHDESAFICTSENCLLNSKLEREVRLA